MAKNIPPLHSPIEGDDIAGSLPATNQHAYLNREEPRCQNAFRAVAYLKLKETFEDAAFRLGNLSLRAVAYPGEAVRISSRQRIFEQVD